MKFKIMLLCLFLSLVSTFATADEASHKAAAEELLVLSNPDELMQKVWEQVSAMMDQQFQQLGATEELKPVFKKYSDRMFKLINDDLSFKNLKDELTAIYVKTYSEAELRGISDFYKSPVGKVFLDKMPELMQETMVVTQAKMQPLMQTVIGLSKEMSEEIEKLKKQ